MEKLLAPLWPCNDPQYM